MTEHFADDTPIRRSEEDRFGRWPFAERIAHVLSTRGEKSSLAIGIYGPWGDGKTSVLNMIAGVLERSPDVLCTRFNPWHFEDEPRLVRAFFDTLAGAFQQLPQRAGEDVATLLTGYGRRLAAPMVVGDAGGGPVAAPQSADTMLSTAALDGLKERINSRLATLGRRIIVLVDDVDRLGRGGIHVLLKLVNLPASFDTVAYVLAIDADVAARALGERYAEGGVEAGRQFLEKIIQVPLHLPDATVADLQAACLSGISVVIDENGITFSEAAAESFARDFARGVLPGLRTPRQVKRYLNTIRFAVPLLKGEVHIVDQLLLEAMRTVYPRVYLCVRDNPAVFCGAVPRVADEQLGDSHPQTAVLAIIEAGLNNLSDPERAGARHLLTTLFPRLNSVFGHTTFPAEWDLAWSAERRLTAPEYFRRYFEYAVPVRDVADQNVAALINACNMSRTDAVDMELHGFGRRGAWMAAFEKLEGHAASLEPGGIAVLLRALAKHANAFPPTGGHFALTASAEGRGAALVAALVRRIESPSERATLTLDVVKCSTSLPFAAACLRLISRSGQGSEADPRAAVDVRMAGDALAKRIAAALADTPELERHGAALVTLLSTWKAYGAAGELEAFLKRRFAARPEALASTLLTLAGAPDQDKASDGSFSAVNLDTVTTLISPDFVAELLTAHGNRVTDAMTFEDTYQLPAPLRTAAQYVLLARNQRKR
jgi:hypothetical protein